MHLAEPGGAQRARERADHTDYAAHLADLGDYRYLNSWDSIPQYWRGGVVGGREQLQQTHMSSANLLAPQRLQTSECARAFLLHGLSSDALPMHFRSLEGSVCLNFSLSMGCVTHGRVLSFCMSVDGFS